MKKVTHLIEGYARQTKTGWLATSSTVLIRDSGKIILVDPGINRKLLLRKLKEEHLTPDDINIVFMSHFHPDHVFLVALFEKAIALDGETMYRNDSEEGYSGTIPTTLIKLLPTPGHANEHTSLVVKDGADRIVIAQDVFWWVDGEEQRVDDYNELINREDLFMVDFEALRESRRKVLEIADYIIPGHGKMFRNPHKK